jgi:hypothetical protein
VIIRPIVLLSMTAALAAPAAAATYSAKLTSPTNGRIIARDINWACAGNSCLGATAESRPAVLCQALAKKAGKVENFLVDGRAFNDAELGRCNAAIKAAAGKAAGGQ